MRRGVLTLLALFGASSVAWAQVQFVRPQLLAEAANVSPEQVVARLMAFDQNSDGRIAANELSERMRPIVDRGDQDGDRALDAREILALAVAPSAISARSFPPSGGYSFGDEAGLSSKAHVEGALEDLRLTSDKRERALPIVRAYVDVVEQRATADLLSEMETLLSPQQLAALTAALNDQKRRMTVRMKGGEGERVFFMPMRGDLSRRLENMQLAAPKNEQARAALDKFKIRIRLGAATDRSGLLAQLNDILTAEELDNFGAALDRRPVVANRFAMLNDLVRVNREQIEIKPAILVEPTFDTLISR